MTLQSSLEPRMLQIVPDFMVPMLIVCVFVLHRRSNRNLVSFTTMFTLIDVAFHSSHVILYSFLKYTMEGKSNSYLSIISIKHRSFPSYCMGENDWTVLEFNTMTYMYTCPLLIGLPFKHI